MDKLSAQDRRLLEEIARVRATIDRAGAAVSDLGRKLAAATVENDALRRQVAAPVPRRGDEIESWIARHRDTFLDGEGDRTGAWYAVDELLDDYHEHADKGVPLDRKVEG